MQDGVVVVTQGAGEVQDSRRREREKKIQKCPVDVVGAVDVKPVMLGRTCKRGRLEAVRDAAPRSAAQAQHRTANSRSWWRWRNASTPRLLSLFIWGYRGTFDAVVVACTTV